MGNRYISLPAGRAFASATQTIIGQTTLAFYVGINSLGGFFLNPVRFPLDFDPGAPTDLRILIAPVANSLVNGQHVRFQWRASTIYNGVITDLGTVEMTWPVPDAWLTTQPQFVLLDNGTGHTFDAHTLTPQSTFGLRVARDGGDIADTFAQSLSIAEYTELIFRSRNFFIPDGLLG